MSTDRRRHLRVLVPGAFCELLVDGVTVGVVPIEDVSDSGVFVAFPRPVIPARTPVTLRFIEEAEPFSIEGVVAQVVPSGSTRASGYGIELKDPPADTVERVVAQRTPPHGTSIDLPEPPPTPPPPTLQPATPHATDHAENATPVVILGLASGQAPQIAIALSLFGAESLFFAEVRPFFSALDRRVRVVLVELGVLEAGGATVAQIRTTCARARIVVAAEKLPDVDVRAKLLRQGADEILLLPYDAFPVLAKLHAAARVSPRR